MLQPFSLLPGGRVCPCVAAVGGGVFFVFRVRSNLEPVHRGIFDIFSISSCVLSANQRCTCEADFLSFVGVPDSLCCAPRLVSYQLPCGSVGVSPTAASDASPFVPPEPLEWVDSLVGWTSEICACVLKFGPLAKSDECEGAHPNPVAVISLVPSNSIELL